MKIVNIPAIIDAENCVKPKVVLPLSNLKIDLILFHNLLIY